MHIRSAGEVGIPTVLSTLGICIVFVPFSVGRHTTRYLFSPLSVSVIVRVGRPRCCRSRWCGVVQDLIGVGFATGGGSVDDVDSEHYGDLP